MHRQQFAAGISGFSGRTQIHLGLKKQQLFKIFNCKNTTADKLVSVADIELLLLPQHTVRQRLQQTAEAAAL